MTDTIPPRPSTSSSRRVEHGELEVATHQRRYRLAASALEAAEDAKRTHRLGEPAELGQAELLEREAALDLRLRRPADDDLPARQPASGSWLRR